MKKNTYNKNKKHTPTFLALMDYLSKLPREEYKRACEIISFKATIELIKRGELQEMNN